MIVAEFGSRTAALCPSWGGCGEKPRCHSSAPQRKSHDQPILFRQMQMVASDDAVHRMERARPNLEMNSRVHQADQSVVSSETTKRTVRHRPTHPATSCPQTCCYSWAACHHTTAQKRFLRMQFVQRTGPHVAQGSESYYPALRADQDSARSRVSEPTLRNPPRRRGYGNPFQLCFLRGHAQLKRRSSNAARASG